MFKEKVLSSEELRKMQLIQLDMLIDFDRVCRKNGIKYILEGGTLLGAVRHGKFIPWDDDIDVRMLRSEYEKFCKVATQLDKGIFFQSHKTDKNYPWLFSKLRKRGTKAIRLGQEKLRMHNGVFIDIFPCDGVPTNQFLRNIRTIIAIMCRKILYARIAKDSANTVVERIFWRFVSIIPMSFPHMIIDKMIKIFDDKKYNLVGSFGWHGKEDNQGFKKIWFTELTEIEFEGRKFFAPKDWDGFLKYAFGEDYMIPPPVKKQKGSAILSSYYLGK